MPVREIAPGKYRWGRHGKVGTKAEAQAQARAIYASGWREDRKRTSAIHKALSASRKAESTYVLALLRIMGAVHRAVLHVVHKEVLHSPPPEPIERMHRDSVFVSGKGIDGELQVDADPPRVGLGAEFLRRMFRFTKPQTQEAFDRMHKEVDARANPAMRGVLERDLAKRIAERKSLIAIQRPAALQAMVDRARDENVALISRASEDFLDQVKDTLEEHEGEAAEDIAAALAERVGVSQSRAVLIATDQVLKMNSAISEHRQRAAGVEKWRWSSSRDERVRPAHVEVEGMVFSWDDDAREEEMASLLIADEDPDDPAPVAGTPVRCRCVAIPLLAGLDYPDEDEETEGEEVPEGETEEPDDGELEERDAADAWDPEEPRDETGKWTGGGSSGSSGKAAKGSPSRNAQWLKERVATVYYGPSYGGASGTDHAALVAERLEQLMPGASLEQLQKALGGEKARAELTSVTMHDSRNIEVSGKLTYAGQTAGHFTHTYEGTSTGTVDHFDAFFLNDDMQDHGIGKSALRDFLAFDRAHGVDRVEIEAVAIGKYVWAEHGFNWDAATGRSMRGSFRSYMESRGIDHMDAMMASDHAAKAYELAAVVVDDKPVGRDFLLHSAMSYRAQLRLTNGDPGWEHARTKLGL